MASRRKYELSASAIRKHARSVLRFRKRICANCGYDEYVEACHLKPLKHFEQHALLSEINDPANLVFLCPNCHKNLDNGVMQVNLAWTNVYDEDDFEDL